MDSFKQLHPNVRIRITTNFLMEFVLMAILPFMAIYFSSELGAGIAGVLLALNMGIGMLVGLWAGHLSDRIGRKNIMVVAQSIQLVSILAMAMANSYFFDSVWVTFFSFLTANACFNATDPAAEAMIIDNSTEAQRPYIYRLDYWLGNVAYAFGAVIGGLFFESGRFYLFIALFFISLFIWYIVAFRLKETWHQPEKTNSEVSQEAVSIWLRYTNVLKDRRFVLFLLATICIAGLEFQLDKYVAVRLDDQFYMNVLGFELTGVRMFSLIMLINTIGVVLFTMPIAKKANEWNSKVVLTVGLTIYAAAFGIFGFATSFILLIVASLAFTLGEIIYMPIRQNMLASIVADESRGSYMAMEGMMYNLAMLISSFMLTISAFIQVGGMSMIFILMGIIGLICYRLAVGEAGQAEEKENAL